MRMYTNVISNIIILIVIILIKNGILARVTYWKYLLILKRKQRFKAQLLLCIIVGLSQIRESISIGISMTDKRNISDFISV